MTIEYPTSGHITERTRTNIESIDRIFRYYIVPREIQYHADALQGRLPFFLQCKGSTKSINFTVPTAAVEVHLSFSLNLCSNSSFISSIYLSIVIIILTRSLLPYDEINYDQI